MLPIDLYPWVDDNRQFNINAFGVGGYRSQFVNLQDANASILSSGNFWDTDMGRDISIFGKDVSSFGDFIYENNNGIGLSLEIAETGFAEGLEAVLHSPTLYTKGAQVLGKVGGAGIIGLNLALTTSTLVKEYQSGDFDTHSIVNGAVTIVTAAATGIGIAIATGAIVVTSPIWGTGLAIGGAVVGVGYAVAQVAGIDEWIDNNWSIKR